MTINILDPRTAEQIAAGEVIENPASVVKELVENSLDAGATRVEIQITGGGKKAITVIDDGCGMVPAELPLAFQRFATSKLAVLDDLNRITSLGFRGEALPSIAAVSRVTITSRPRGALSAARLSLAGGEIIARRRPAPGRTAVEVRDLFYNTPGRLKFLRSARWNRAVLARCSPDWSWLTLKPPLAWPASRNRSFRPPETATCSMPSGLSTAMNVPPP